MKLVNLFVIVCMFNSLVTINAQSINDLDFLIGKWEVREDNKEKDWWEKSTRIGQFVLDSMYIELKSNALSSSGKKRTYRWYIHFNSKTQEFEMISLFSNWHSVLFDILDWNKESRKLTIRNKIDLNTSDYHERFGEIIFSEDFNLYEWKGQNKYGDANSPSIWNYIEKGIRIK